MIAFTEHTDLCQRQNAGYTHYLLPVGGLLHEWWVCNACGNEVGRRVTER